ncbi:hypothetical protein [Halobacteriovorax sp. RZ-2]|uniref:hypothetical protein n=1 Tax=unclassified Halobacteriovorax TaxID=2639665 RepID=UPI003711108A
MYKKYFFILLFFGLLLSIVSYDSFSSNKDSKMVNIEKIALLEKELVRINSVDFYSSDRLDELKIIKQRLLKLKAIKNEN